jgi:hypothetical protein
MRSLLTSSLLLLAAACGDVDVRSVRVGPAVPETLQGEWVGSWTSSLTAASGALQVRVQEFRAEPVVALQIDNPCLLPRDYQLVLRPTSIELRADGETVLAAELGAGRTLTGTFQCQADQGTWTASWVRALPTLGDLSGRWTGTLTPAVALPAVPMPRPLQLDLEQSVVGGSVVLTGVLDVPELLGLPIAVSGYTIFRDDTFDLLLRAEQPGAPTVVLSALGARQPLSVELGLAQAFGAAPLPFAQATFSLQWQSP